MGRKAVIARSGVLYGCKILALLLACWIVGLALLCAVYLLPTERARENARKYSDLYMADAYYPTGYDVAGLGPITDSYMMGIAMYPGQKGLLSEAMEANRSGYDVSVPPLEAFQRVLDGGEDAVILEYPRYWHGYLVFLKPALQFLNYWDIRMLNTTAQIVLIVTVAALLMRKKRGWLLVPYAVSLLFLCMPAMAYCMAYSPVFYISHIGMIYLLLRSDKIAAGCDMPYCFLLLGAATAYFDFLTFPIAALGLPMCIWLSYRTQKKPLDNVLRVVRLSLCWGIGYVGMWAGKWLIGAAILGRRVGSVIDGAGIQERMTYDYVGFGGERITPLDVLIVNFGKYRDVAFLLVYAALLILLVVLLVRNRKRLCLRSGIREALPYLLTAMMPIVWYLAIAMHSYSHCGFTCRALCVSALAGSAGVSCMVRSRTESSDCGG